jgi:hypothetical protein
MKNLHNFFFNINKISFLLIILPYFTFNFFFIFNSFFFSYINLFLITFALILIEIFLKIYLEYIKTYNFISLIFSSIIIFIYGIYFIPFFQDLFFDYFSIRVRGRFVLVLILFILVIIQLMIRKINYIKYLNIFLIIFSSINLLSGLVKNNNSNLNLTKLSSNYHKIDLADKSKKSVILIITDEYSSPIELYKIYNDSSVFNFSKNLQKSNWLVRDSSFSFERSTIHSISSMFNFNLSKGTNYSSFDKFEIGSSKLLSSSLYDSLDSKGVSFTNFGIFKVGNSIPINNLYKYPESFLDVFLFNTVYNHIINNTGGLKLEGFDSRFYSREVHNKFIFNSMTDSLMNNGVSGSFTYVHLYMPHSPFIFEGEFDKSLIKDTNSYFEYWKFTNKKLEILLFYLLKSNKYKIVLTGDHGFRGDSRIDYKNTFTAFYGFSEEDLNSIESVQDLGILINACY